MGNYLMTVGLIFFLLFAGIAIDRLYRNFAARNPQLGPYRDTGKCGCCKGGSACSDTSCADDPAAPHRS